MNISLTKLGLPALCLSVLLAGCSSAPVDETTSTIEDTTVQTASVEMEAETAPAMVEEIEEPTNNAREGKRCQIKGFSYGVKRCFSEAANQSRKLD